MNWLKKEVTGKWLLVYIFGFGIVSIPYCLGCLLFLDYLNIGPVKRTVNLTWFVSIITPFLIFPMAFLEECLFRLPLSMAINNSWPDKKLFYLILIVSLVFGALHGNAINVAIQGIDGILLSIIFLKCGGCQRHYGKALITCATAHACKNMYVWIIGKVILTYM